MYGRNRYFSVIISPELVADYMESKGIDDVTISDAWKHLNSMGTCGIDANDIWILASVIAEHMDDAVLNQLADDYGCDIFDSSKAFMPYTDDLIGHIADEVLEECCRTVIDF